MQGHEVILPLSLSLPHTLDGPTSRPRVSRFPDEAIIDSRVGINSAGRFLFARGINGDKYIVLCVGSLLNIITDINISVYQPLTRHNLQSTWLLLNQNTAH